MKRIIAIFMCLIFIFLFACHPKEPESSNEEELVPEVVPTLIEKELEYSNFYKYITIKINQINQQSTHTRDQIWNGITIKHYSILTTFSVTSTSNNPSYIFENAKFAYNTGFNIPNTNTTIYARVNINQDGSGYDTFTIMEYDLTVPYKAYTFQKYFGAPNDNTPFYFLGIYGKVKYYE